MSTQIGSSITTYENTIMRILLPAEPWLEKYYLCAGHSELPENARNRTGPYERKILNKMLHPILPVVCVMGDIGSGKSTTLEHLIKYHLSHRALKPDDLTKPHNNHSLKKILLGRIDCKNFKEEEKEIGETKILSEILNELRARIQFLIDAEDEFINFWNYLLKNYYENNKSVSDVARHIANAETPQTEGSNSIDIITSRENLLDKLNRDGEWYFRYLILLWKYAINRENPYQNNVRITNGIFVLDNLDSISPNVQERIYLTVLKCADQTGPTFVLFLRPETFARLGDADNLVDRVEHESPEPGEVVLDRLSRFNQNPEKYLRNEQYFSKDEKETVIAFVDRLLPSLRDRRGYFFRFLNAASGRSIRIGIIIAQGILLFDKTEMKKVELTSHFVIRECIRQGRPVYEWASNSTIENPFCVYGFGTENVLLKIRLLQCLKLSSPYDEIRTDSTGQQQKVFVYGKRPAKMLNELRNIFVSFGYEKHIFIEAINQLIRRECQLLTSNGLDEYSETLGHEDELIFLTKIGEGYLSELIKSADFVQEVMLDAMPTLRAYISKDSLIEKMDILGRFLTELSEIDLHETRSAITQLGLKWYIPKFGAQLLSTQMVQPIYTSVGRILRTSARQQSDPYYLSELNNLMSIFTSLVRKSEYNSREVLRIEVKSVEEINLKES